MMVGKMAAMLTIAGVNVAVSSSSSSSVHRVRADGMAGSAGSSGWPCDGRGHERMATTARRGRGVTLPREADVHEIGTRWGDLASPR